MTCQHPNCSHSIHSICTTHCHWSLCQEHINEHKNCLLIEFEEVLEDLIKPTNELSKSIEQIKDNKAKEVYSIKQSHQNQLNEIEEKLIEINQLQNQFNKISEHLIKIKTNEDILIQNDFQQIDILFDKINQYKNSLDKGENIKPIIPNQCPLTSLNIYGLLSTHNVRLCPPNKKLRNLFEHLRNFHHLKSDYSNQIIQAIKLNLDPIQTKLFPPDAQIIDERKPCPFHDTPKENGIRCTPCTSLITEKFLPVHLKTVHRLRLPQIKDILNSR